MSKELSNVIRDFKQCIKKAIKFSIANSKSLGFNNANASMSKDKEVYGIFKKQLILFLQGHMSKIPSLLIKDGAASFDISPSSTSLFINPQSYGIHISIELRYAYLMHELPWTVPEMILEIKALLHYKGRIEYQLTNTLANWNNTLANLHVELDKGNKLVLLPDFSLIVVEANNKSALNPIEKKFADYHKEKKNRFTYKSSDWMKHPVLTDYRFNSSSSQILSYVRKSSRFFGMLGEYQKSDIFSSYSIHAGAPVIFDTIPSELFTPVTDCGTVIGFGRQTYFEGEKWDSLTGLLSGTSFKGVTILKKNKLAGGKGSETEEGSSYDSSYGNSTTEGGEGSSSGKGGKQKGEPSEEKVNEIEDSSSNNHEKNSNFEVDIKAIQKIDDGFPRNAKDYAGNTYYLDIEKNPILKERLSKLKPAIRKTREKKLKKLNEKYPEGVKFNKKGFPDFSPYRYKHDNNEVLVDIEELHIDPPDNKGTAGSQLDMNKANEMMKEIDPNWKQPVGYTWHHIENTTKLELVPTDLHSTIGHSGGRNTYNFK